MSARFVFDRHSDFIETDLDSVGQDGFTTLFALGIINPMGPTMNALVANGFGSVGERRALLLLMLNPFGQSCDEVGVVTFGETSVSRYLSSSEFPMERRKRTRRGRESKAPPPPRSVEGNGHKTPRKGAKNSI